MTTASKYAAYATTAAGTPSTPHALPAPGGSALAGPEVAGEAVQLCWIGQGLLRGRGLVAIAGLRGETARRGGPARPAADRGRGDREAGGQRGGGSDVEEQRDPAAGRLGEHALAELRHEVSQDLVLRLARDQLLADDRAHLLRDRGIALGDCLRGAHRTHEQPGDRVDAVVEGLGASPGRRHR